MHAPPRKPDFEILDPLKIVTLSMVTALPVRVNFFGNSSLLRPIFVELVRQIKRELTVFSCK